MIEAVHALRAARDEISRCIIGLEREIDLLLAAVLAGGHVLIEGVPGLGKTYLAHTLARVLGCPFRRIQFTPDLMPADILGGYVFNPKEATFSLRKGPIFSNVILADEINRAPAKTQSAMLEVMQERQVTIEGETMAMEAPFIVLATQNPLEHEGVYPLPQAQLDRFSMRLIVEHPSLEEETRILALHRETMPIPSAVTDPAGVVAAQKACAMLTASDDILDVIARLVHATRDREDVQEGASPRVGLDLLRLGRARALLDGRQHVLPDDLKDLLIPVANHRIGVDPRAAIAGLTPDEVLRDALARTKLV